MSNTLANKRIQDPILTQLAQGYHNAELVCEALFPVVEIEKEAGKIPQFGRLAFRLSSTVREVHGDSNRLTPEDITSINVELEEHDLEYPIDYREENEASYNLKQYALSVVQDRIALGREVKVAEIAQNPESYDASNVIQIASYNEKNHPLAIIDAGLDAVTSTIGRKPNVCVIAKDVWAILKQNQELIERIKYTRTGILTPEVFAELIGVQTVKIGGAMQEHEGKLKPLWTDSIILAYVPKTTKSIYEPSFGYTVRRNKGLFVDTYDEKGGKVKIIRCTDIHKPHLLGKSAGYLIKGALNLAQQTK
ncbi:inorganic pyrophosphatase [Glaesserella parasuis]|uniref:inorganic pyrophosphatase n=1 Tax=Glaesserella parasuis TaxID=738 RepID=UPI0024363F85|nr:inorganic pyrophosphatase [Glaesserella parasuis]MDG6309827.1 inorganic pyrophosphatase [Glaesserella parasuis]